MQIISSNSHQRQKLLNIKFPKKTFLSFYFWKLNGFEVTCNTCNKNNLYNPFNNISVIRSTNYMFIFECTHCYNNLHFFISAPTSPFPIWLYVFLHILTLWIKKHTLHRKYIFSKSESIMKMLYLIDDLV